MIDAPDVLAAVSSGEAELGEGGRILIRRSGTEPLIRVMAEGLDEARVTLVVDNIVDVLSAVSA